MEIKYTKSSLELASIMILSEQPVSMKDLLAREKAKKAKGGKTIAQSMQTMTNDDLLPSPEEITKFLSNVWDTYKHDIMFAGSMLALLIPIPGFNILVSGLISGSDAAMYWAEGNRYDAMLMATFMLLPGIGKLAMKIPGLKQLGAKGMRVLFRKVIQAKRGAKVVFGKSEKLVLKYLPKNGKLIQSELAKKSSKIVKKVAQSKAASDYSRKVGRGVLRAPFGAAKVATPYAAADVIQRQIIDPLYKSSGMDISDIESQSDDLLQQIKQQSLQGK